MRSVTSNVERGRSTVAVGWPVRLALARGRHRVRCRRGEPLVRRGARAGPRPRGLPVAGRRRAALVRRRSGTADPLRSAERLRHSAHARRPVPFARARADGRRHRDTRRANRPASRTTPRPPRTRLPPRTRPARAMSAAPSRSWRIARTLRTPAMHRPGRRRDPRTPSARALTFPRRPRQETRAILGLPGGQLRDGGRAFRRSAGWSSSGPSTTGQVRTRGRSCSACSGRSRASWS